ncbi:MAG TPA: hypothetical protein VMF61_01760 [Candidatus Acidoferrales bacterium]|nr:hypothetical protein [Candidatus Acidoferrales bacterium]
MRLKTITSIVLLVIATAACSGGSPGTVLPQSVSTQTQPAAPGAGFQMPTLGKPDAITTAISLAGSIVSTYSGGFTLEAPGCGEIHVSDGSAKMLGARPASGQTAAVTGTGSCATSIAASEVTTASATPVTLKGTITAVYAGGFTLDSSGCGNVHVGTSASTTLSGPALAVNRTASVSGNGSCDSAVAKSVSTSGSSGSSQTHVLTEDYLGKPNGSTSVSWSQAAQYLTWAQTGTQSVNAISAAGIKTQFYSNPNRTSAGVGDPLYNSNEATFAHDCSGQRVTDTYDHDVTQYVMAIGGSAMQQLWANYIKSILASSHYDSVFEDGAGTLTADAPYTPFSAMPCDYSDAEWLDEGEALNQVSPIPVMVNGLEALDGHNVTENLALLGSSNTAGGDFEGCYTDNSTLIYDGWAWQAVENTEIDVNARGKTFLCQERNTAPASSNLSLRIYALASFLLTYNPSTSILWEEFATPSGFNVGPETRLVALQPLGASPSSISDLEVSGNYGRQYGACYVGGSSVGPCAVVVNQDIVAHPNPYSGYSHTMTLSGSGVLDGGTMSTDGPAPPSSVPPKSAAILFQ